MNIRRNKQIEYIVTVTVTITATVTIIITYMKNSDWLRAVQLKSNTSAKSVIPVQITNQNS